MGALTVFELVSGYALGASRRHYGLFASVDGAKAEAARLFSELQDVYDEIDESEDREDYKPIFPEIEWTFEQTYWMFGDEPQPDGDPRWIGRYAESVASCYHIIERIVNP